MQFFRRPDKHGSRSAHPLENFTEAVIEGSDDIETLRPGGDSRRSPPAETCALKCQRGASITTAAARGELPAEEVAVALKLVLSMEGIPCQ